MDHRNPFADAPDIAVDLNLGLWSMAIGVVALEVGQNLEIGFIYYAIAPPLLAFGLYKLLTLFMEQEFGKESSRHEKTGNRM